MTKATISSKGQIAPGSVCGSGSAEPHILAFPAMVAGVVDCTRNCTCWAPTDWLRLQRGGVRNLLNSIFDVIVPVKVHYQWRP